MPLSTEQYTMLCYFLFHQVTGVDPVARLASDELLAYLGLDNAGVIRSMSGPDLAPNKLRRDLNLSPKGTALLATLEAVDGQLISLSLFLRKMHEGDCDRYLRDYKPNDINALALLESGSPEVHNYVKDWDPQDNLTTTQAKALAVKDAPSLRSFITYININYPDISYLLLKTPQDNYSLIGNKKDQHLHKLVTDVVNASNLNQTFKLESSRTTGRTLFMLLNDHFLDNADVQTEIHILNTKFATTNLTSTVAALLEEVHGIVSRLAALGVVTENMSLYMKIKSIIEASENSHLLNCCMIFRGMNPSPDGATLKKFMEFLTSDPTAMKLDLSSKVNELKNTNNGNKSSSKSDKKKERKVQMKKGFNAAMNRLTNKEEASLDGLPTEAVNYFKEVRKKWNDKTLGVHSNIKLIFNKHVKEGSGSLDFEAFMEEIIKEHKDQTLQPPSTTPSDRRPQQNPNVALANALEVLPDAFAAQVFSQDDGSANGRSL